MTVHPINLTTETFKSEVFESSELVLVDFWAPWCGPCRVMNPIITEIAQEYESVLKVAKLNVDEADAIASQYQITSIPVLLVFRNSEVIERLPGLMTTSQIRKRLQALGIASKVAV